MVQRIRTGYNIESLTGDHVLVNKCVKGHIEDDEGNVQLYRTEDAYDTTTFAEIMMLGPRCRNLTDEHLGLLVRCPEMSGSMRWVADEMYIIKEKYIMDKIGYLVVDS